MTFDEILSQVLALLQHQGRVSYRALKVRFTLDDDTLEALKDEIIYAQRLAVDEDGRVLVWTGDGDTAPQAPVAPAPRAERAPLSYTPPYLAEKILTSRSALEGERKQVTVLFADIKGSMELLADRDPEEARQLLDPVLERMMAAVHRYEGTVNQVMGDGIMALFGAPLAHEDHAVRACYAALAMQAAVKQYAAGVQRSHGVPVQMRVGLNAGEVVGRLEEAYALAEDALALTRERQERCHQGYALRLLAEIAAHHAPPDVDQAEDYYRQSLALAEELGMRPLVAHCHHGLGILYTRTGQREQARAALSAARDLYRAMEMTFWLPQTEVVLAQIEAQ